MEDVSVWWPRKVRTASMGSNYRRSRPSNEFRSLSLDIRLVIWRVLQNQAVWRRVESTSEPWNEGGGGSGSLQIPMSTHHPLSLPPQLLPQWVDKPPEAHLTANASQRFWLMRPLVPTGGLKCRGRGRECLPDRARVGERNPPTPSTSTSPSSACQPHAMGIGRGPVDRSRATRHESPSYQPAFEEWLVLNVLP